MFADRAQIKLMTIHDDRTGQGENLAFPSMSSCAAVICVLNDRLVGVHKTQGAISGRQLRLFNYAKTLIGGEQVHKVVIAGWRAEKGSTVGHAPNEIRKALDLPDVATYYLNYATTTHGPKDDSAYKTGFFKTAMTDLCTFAHRNGTDFPMITVKRSSKVANSNIDMNRFKEMGHPFASDICQFGSLEEDVTASNDHTIGQDQFTRLV